MRRWIARSALSIVLRRMKRNRSPRSMSGSRSRQKNSEGERR